MGDKKGGYRLVSLKLIELSTMTACAGLYQAIESSHDKPLCLCDILVSGAKKNNVYITAIKGTNKYTLKHIYGYNLEVTNEDVVTISQDSEGIELPVPEASDDGKIVGVNVQGKYVLKPSVEDQVAQAQSGTIQDVLGLDSQGKLIKGAVSGGTKLYLHTLNDNVRVISTRATAYTNYYNDGYDKDSGVVRIFKAEDGGTYDDVLLVSRTGLRGYFVTPTISGDSVSFAYESAPSISSDVVTEL